MFDDRIKKLRKARGITQAQAAKDLDLPQKTYCNYERDEREPNSTVLVKLALYYGVTVDYLLGFMPKNEESPPLIGNDERKAFEKRLESLSTKSLEEIDKFLDYLIWKEQQE